LKNMKRFGIKIEYRNIYRVWKNRDLRVRIIRIFNSRIDKEDKWWDWLINTSILGN
jgi:hypothetical protein